MFEGLLQRQGETVDIQSIRTGADPVFEKWDQMAYIGISELVCNSAALSLYNTGALRTEVGTT